MKIMSEFEFNRLINEAETRGFERATREAYKEREDRDFREGLWRKMNELRREVRQRIERLEKATGNEYAPTCGCADADTCKTAPF